MNFYSNEHFILLIIGKPGTGKTQEIRKILKNEIDPIKRVLLITPFEGDWKDIQTLEDPLENTFSYEGCRKVIAKNFNDIEYISRFHDGIIIFEDFHALNVGPDPRLRDLLLQRRQKNVNMIFTGIGFTVLPAMLFIYSSYFQIFATIDTPKRLKKIAFNYPYLKAISIVVNNRALKNPHYNEIIEN